MIQVGKRVGSHDTSGKEVGNIIIQLAMKRVKTNLFILMRMYLSRDHQYQDDMFLVNTGILAEGDKIDKVGWKRTVGIFLTTGDDVGEIIW